MADRVSASTRLRTRIVAEEEILRYRGNHALWHKHVHNVDLDPVQVLKMIEMDEHPNTIDFSCRRTGKTAVKEMYLVEHNAVNADQELGIVAPREQQALVNLNYHMEAIRRSPILDAYIDFKNGRRTIADTYYQFANRSIARSYGIMSQVDGGDLTAASLEEVDDMPQERLFGRFLLMMGATRRLGASRDSVNQPQIRITGVFKGADTLQAMIDSKQYHMLPVVDVYLGIELGILNAAFMKEMQLMLSAEEYLRQLMCRNVSARNLIWEKWLRRALTVGLHAGIEPAEPVPGGRYQKRGLVAFGYDHSGHGEDPQASKYGFVVDEQIGNFTCTIFAKTWAPGTDEKIVKNDLKGFWRYFRPDYACGDAFGIGMLTQLNDELYLEGLVDVDRMTIGDGESTSSTWKHWSFSPIRFEGTVKHSMATALRSCFNSNQAALCHLDDDVDVIDAHLPEHRQGKLGARRAHVSNSAAEDLALLYKQLTNIRADTTKAAYATYKMVNKKLGDDLFDAKMAAFWALVTRGAAQPPAVVQIAQKSRAQLLGAVPLAITH